MAWTLNPFTNKLDFYDKLTNPLQFKDNISVNTEFPLIALVQTGWFYTVSASVTDNAGVTYTNTGQSFIDGDEIAWNGTSWSLLGNLTSVTRSFGITVDGAGTAVTTGSKGFITIPYTCTINNWYLAANASGSVVIDIKRSGTSIVGAGNKPTLSSAISGNAAATSWTSVAVTAGDILEFNVDSAATLTRVNLVIKAVQ